MAEEPCILLVVAPFYDGITDHMIVGAQRVLQEASCHSEIISVPGALEIPGAIALAAQSGRFSGYVALGCVIRGETSHYDTVCMESARGLMDLTLYHRLAIGNGIITVEDEQQAHARANPNDKNKGGEAAKACLALMKLREKWKKPSSFTDESHHFKLAGSDTNHG